ncbi:MAG: class I SAM-dependent methyltransferase [Acidimicrobiales bacterium]
MSAPPCRACDSDRTYPFLDLGSTPLADGLVWEKDLDKSELVFPLDVMLCEDCALVQITETVDPEILYGEDYPYYSSFSPHLLEHSRKNVEAILESRNLDETSLVVEVASNDGYLLKNYQAAGIPVLGIDPAPGPVKAAVESGVPTRCEFFGAEVAKGLVSEGIRADVIHGNNVLAHVADTNGFVEGLATLLKDDGVIAIEAPYVRDLIEHLEFDTIYHEHLCYFSATSFKNLFRRHGLHLNDVKWLEIHGGTLRYFAGKTEQPTQALLDLLAEEEAMGLGAREYYETFGARVENLRTDLRKLLTSLKEDGRTIAAYGAAAKGATMINYTGLGTDVIDYVVDRNTHKHGRYMPGQKIPIRPPETLAEEMPDYVLVLAWNFLEEISAQQSDYLAKGGKFIRPVPTPEIVS